MEVAVQGEGAGFELDWPVIAASDLGSHPTLGADLLDGRRDGVTVTGVFSEAEAAAAVDGLESVAPGAAIDHYFGRLLGMALGMITREEGSRERYLDDAARCAPLYREGFGFDPFERLASVLAPAFPDLEISAPEEAGRPYNPGQVRWWEPGRGGLAAHVGNEFRRQLEDGAMKHLVTTTAITNHLSYFVVLQRADVGGELSVYDLLWDDHKGRDSWGDSMPDDSWIDQIPSVKLDPGPGDLILFGGGWRWHRVDPPVGVVPRITWGGFAARSVDGRQLHFWA